MSIRRRTASDNHELVEIWNRSVRATHTFLNEEDIQYFYVQVRDVYLPSMDEVWVYETNSSTTTTTTTIAGFIAMNETHVNMLFIDPAYRGQGIGTKLLDHVKSLLCSCDSAVMISVDVNEQNPQAHGFYLHYGFRDVGRSELDPTGRPFPLIHMSLLLDCKEREL